MSVIDPSMLQLISNVGFPIALVFILIWRIETKLEKLIEKVAEMASEVAKAHQ